VQDHRDMLATKKGKHPQWINMMWGHAHHTKTLKFGPSSRVGIASLILMITSTFILGQLQYLVCLMLHLV
jgi:hypothetical protein